MHKISLYFLLVIAFWPAGCKEDSNIPPLTIEDEWILDSIPSGSGLVIQDDTAFIIGDDATGVYRLFLAGDQQDKIPIIGLNDSLYREPKAIKHDFESATLAEWQGKNYLLAFGSGSNRTSRDSMLLLNVHDYKEQKILSLRNFYKQLQVITGSDTLQWNIEAATVVNGSLVLCNRGNNLIISIELEDFLAYLFNHEALFPKIIYRQVRLPQIQGKEARLSGACTLDEHRILFSASVEDTPDWITDGPVLGSFIGIYSIGKATIDTAYLLSGENQQPLPEKIESLDIRRRQASGLLSILAISDNDNGSSKLFRIRMAVKE